MKTLLLFLLLQSAEVAQVVQLTWDGTVSFADGSYTISRNDGRVMTVTTPALTDFQVQPGKTYVYTIQPGNQKLTVTLPPQGDVKIQFKPGQKLTNLSISKRKTDLSSTMQCTVNKSTTVEWVK